jgi:hypothetical protein
MDHAQSEIRREIESARGDMVEKISILETRISGAVEEVKRLGDIKYQVEHRPWLMMGVSALAGYMISGLIFSRPKRRTAIVHWPDLGKTERISLGRRSSFIGGIVSSILVALARDLTANTLKNWRAPARGNSPTAKAEEPRRLH